ncbi:MAG TPA: STN domain-containing protein, partial [Saprospiraceae bacterium]|nr:STN domain-containing protein [Saprospiraceae bacterium]
MMRRVQFYQKWIWAICLASAFSSHAQDNDSGMSIHITFHQAQLSQALKELSTASGVNVVFSPDMVPDRIITREFDASLNAILTILLDDTGLAFREQDGQIILYRDAGYFAPFSISGYVEDGETGERLFAAHVYDLISGA